MVHPWTGLSTGHRCSIEIRGIWRPSQHFLFLRPFLNSFFPVCGERTLILGNTVAMKGGDLIFNNAEVGYACRNNIPVSAGSQRFPAEHCSEYHMASTSLPSSSCILVPCVPRVSNTHATQPSTRCKRNHDSSDHNHLLPFLHHPVVMLTCSLYCRHFFCGS